MFLGSAAGCSWMVGLVRCDGPGWRLLLTTYVVDQLVPECLPLFICFKSRLLSGYLVPSLELHFGISVKLRCFGQRRRYYGWCREYLTGLRGSHMVLSFLNLTEETVLDEWDPVGCLEFAT